MKRFLIALQFLTIIPVRLKGMLSEEELGRASPFFIPVGLFQGISMVAVLAMSEMVFNQELAMALTLVFYIVLSGAFHLDGLSDTFDALAVKSTGDPVVDREKRHLAMKDSCAGPSGVLAVVSVLLLKYLSLKNISHLIPSLYYLSFLLMPVVSRWAMNIAMFHGRPAKTDGLGYVFIRNFRVREFLISWAWLLIVYSLIYMLFKQYLPQGFFTFCIFVTAGLYLLSLLWLFFINKRFGGQTGDTLGALNEIGELSFLVLTIIWWRFSI